MKFLSVKESTSQYRHVMTEEEYEAEAQEYTDDENERARATYSN